MSDKLLRRPRTLSKRENYWRLTESLLLILCTTHVTCFCPNTTVQSMFSKDIGVSCKSQHYYCSLGDQQNVSIDSQFGNHQVDVFLTVHVILCLSQTLQSSEVHVLMLTLLILLRKAVALISVNPCVKNIANPKDSSSKINSVNIGLTQIG